MRHKTSIYSGLIAVLFIITFYPALKILISKWANSDEYTHAFLVLPVICYMIWKKKDQLINISKRYSMVALLLIIPSLLMYYFALLTEVHTVILLSMYFTFLGITAYTAGIQSLKLLATPLVLLLTLIPVPEQLYTMLTFPLQLKVSEMSEMILRSLQMPMLREGNVMNVPGMSFEVIEACSGLRSVVALLTLSILMGSFSLKKLHSKMFLVIASIPIAILVNLIRVVTMIMFYYYFSIDLTQGAWHTTTGLIVFVIAMFLLFLLQNILEKWELKRTPNS